MLIQMLYLFWVMMRRNTVGMIRRFETSLRSLLRLHKIRMMPHYWLCTQPSFLASLVFYQALGWDRKDIPKRRIISTISHRVITQ